MKKVEFVQVKSELYGYSPLFKGSHYVFWNIEETVKERMQDGWEYCGWLPIETREAGDVEKISLIFQKDE